MSRHLGGGRFANPVSHLCEAGFWVLEGFMQ